MNVHQMAIPIDLLMPPSAPPEAAPAAPLGTKPIFLGTVNEKDYYLDVNPASDTYNQVIWSVPDIRDAIVAGPGMQIVAADYSQIELRLMAWISKDPWLTAAINSRLDMHTWMATDLFGKELGFTYEEMDAAIKDKSHPRNAEFSMLRSRTKRCSFGIPYGISPKGLSFLIDSTPEVAAALMARYFAKAKVLRQWLDNQKIKAISTGFTTSLYGRKRFYEIPHPDDPKAEDLLEQIGRWSGNFPMQSSNADMLKLAMTYLYAALREGVLSAKPKWKARILFVVHDEIVTECLTEYAQDMKLLVEKSMNWAYEKLVGSANVFHEATAVVADVWSKA